MVVYGHSLCGCLGACLTELILLKHIYVPGVEVKSKQSFHPQGTHIVQRTKHIRTQSKFSLPSLRKKNLIPTENYKSFHNSR